MSLTNHAKQSFGFLALTAVVAPLIAQSALALNPQPLPPGRSQSVASNQLSGKGLQEDLNPQPLPPGYTAGGTAGGQQFDRGSKVSLNPQPLPPGYTAGGTAGGQQFDRGSKVSLNPQPLPPGFSADGNILNTEAIHACASGNHYLGGGEMFCRKAGGEHEDSKDDFAFLDSANGSEGGLAPAENPAHARSDSKGQGAPLGLGMLVVPGAISGLTGGIHTERSGLGGQLLGSAALSPACSGKHFIGSNSSGSGAGKISLTAGSSSTGSPAQGGLHFISGAGGHRM